MSAAAPQIQQSSDTPREEKHDAKDNKTASKTDKTVKTLRLSDGDGGILRKFNITSDWAKIIAALLFVLIVVTIVMHVLLLQNKCYPGQCPPPNTISSFLLIKA